MSVFLYMYQIAVSYTHLEQWKETKGRHAFNGMAYAVIRAGQNKGELTLTVQASGVAVSYTHLFASCKCKHALSCLFSNSSFS